MLPLFTNISNHFHKPIINFRLCGVVTWSVPVKQSVILFCLLFLKSIFSKCVYELLSALSELWGFLQLLTSWYEPIYEAHGIFFSLLLHYHQVSYLILGFLSLRHCFLIVTNIGHLMYKGTSCWDVITKNIANATMGLLKINLWDC